MFLKKEYEFIPAPGLIYRVTGGVLDFYMFLGPGPEDVVETFTKVGLQIRMNSTLLNLK